MNRKKFIIIIYSLIVICILISLFFIIYCNKTYNEKDIIVINNYTLTVDRSYITIYNDQNQIISKDQSFLIVILNTNINNEDIVLKIDNKYFLNNNEYQNYFQEIKGNKLVYIIDNNLINNDLYLFYQNKDKTLIKNYSIKLNPINLNNNQKPVDLKLKDEFYLNNYSLKIVDYDIKEKFIITYQKNQKNINTLLNKENSNILKLSFQNNINKDIYKYMSLNYQIKKDKKSCTMNQIYIDDKDIYFSVNNNLINSDKIWITFTSRSQIINYYLK